MKHFRWSLLWLVIGLSLFLTIERFDFEQNNIIDIHSFVYILGVAAVASLILFPSLARLPVSRLIIFWFVVFVALKGLVLHQRAIIGGVYTYLTLTEAAFLLLLVYLAHQVAQGLHDFQQATEYISLADAGRRLLQVEEAGAEIRREMMRSRHFHRALSVVIVKPDKKSLAEMAPRLVAEIQRSVAELCATTRLARAIREQSRVVDMVMEDRENGRFVILCPEIDAQGTALLADRICKAISNQMGLKVSFGVASFPEEALTFESLIAEAASSLELAQYHAVTEAKLRPAQEMLQAKP